MERSVPPCGTLSPQLNALFLRGFCPAAAALIAEEGMDQAVDEIDALCKELSNAKKRLGKKYEVLSVTNGKGTVIADGVGGRDKGIDLSNRAYFKLAKSGKVNVSNPVKSKSSGKPAAPVVSPVYSGKGDVVGTLVAVLKIDYLCEKLATIKIGETGYPFMIDKKGVIIAHPDQKIVFKLNVKDMKGMEHKRMPVKRGVPGSCTCDQEYDPDCRGRVYGDNHSGRSVFRWGHNKTNSRAQRSPNRWESP